MKPLPWAAADIKVLASVRSAFPSSGTKETLVWKSSDSWLRIHLSFSSVQLLSRVQLFVTPWTAARQASLSITSSWGLPKLMSTESVMPSNHLILFSFELW